MIKWVAVFAIRLRPRRQESLQATADRRQGDQRRWLAFLPRRCRALLPAQLFQRKKAITQHPQAGVVINPAPRPPLKMIHPHFFLHLLIALLPRPAALPEPNRLDS